MISRWSPGNNTSAKFDAAVRESHTRFVRVQHKSLVTGVTTTLADTTNGEDTGAGGIESGSVTVDFNSNIRRTLDLSLPPSTSTWALLDSPGGEIQVLSGIRFTDGTTEHVSMGTFIVDTDQIGYGTGGTIDLHCPDRWVKIQRNRFGLNRSSVRHNPAHQEIYRLVRGAWPATTTFPGFTYIAPAWPGFVLHDTSASDEVGALLWDDGDREAAILALCAANGVEVFFNAWGHAVLQPLPVLKGTSVADWTVNAGETGVLIDADQTRDRSVVRNAIIVTTDATDVTFLPVEVKNTTAGDPLNVTGPLGYVAEDWSSASLRNSAQARKAGRARLSKTLGTAKQLTLTASAHPGLDAEHIVAAVLPQLDRNNGAVTTELHFVDSVTHPLTPDGTQTILTRSTRPDTDGN